MSSDLQSAPGQEHGGPTGLDMARKRFQRGSVRLRGKMWYGRWREDEQLPDGQVVRREHSETLGTKKDLPTEKLALRELESRIKHINEVSYRPRLAANFEQFAERWQESVMITHKRSAQSSEKSHIKKHLLPRWGSLAMKQIEADPEAVQAWVSGLKVEPKTQKNIVTTARLMFDTAREWRYVTYNPFDKLRLRPRGLSEDEFALSLEQIRSIINMAPLPWKTLYWILGETGIRAGEVLALGFEHIDLTDPQIRIRRKVWRGEFETVKSRKGIRDFAISAELAEHLKEVAGGRKHGLLFADTEGNPVTYDHALKEVFQPFLEGLNIPRCGFHAFRHGNATLMDQLGVPMQTRMNRLGHEKPVTTLGYTHAVSEDDRVAADGIGKLLTEAIQ